MYTSPLSQVAASIVKYEFPGIFERYTECSKYMKSHFGIGPMFGCFFNFCINMSRPGVPRVMCEPHVDKSNLAVGVCLLLIYGMR